MACAGPVRRDRFVGQRGDLVCVSVKELQDAFDTSKYYLDYTNKDRMKQILSTELEENANYKNVWDTATKIYKSRMIECDEYLPEECPAGCFVAVIAYTMDEPNIYRDFNKESRKLNRAYWKKFPYKSLWYFLTWAVPVIKRNSFTEETMCYRGLDFHFSEKGRHDWNTVYMFKSFTSASLCKSVAEDVMQDYTTPCLVVIIGVPLAGNTVDQLSIYPQEEEVILCPWNCFILINLETEDNQQTLVLRHGGPTDRQNLPYTLRTDQEQPSIWSKCSIM